MLSRIKKYIYLTIGIISLLLGAIGATIPVLPTTPFLLLSSVCFAKGSDRFNNWFKETSLYKKHLEDFVKERAMTLKQKVSILAFANTMILIPIILTNSFHIRIMLICLVIFKLYYFIFRIKTIKPKMITNEK